MQLNLLEKRMSNIRLVPKVVLLMVFSTLLLLTKLWFDANNLEATLLSEGLDPAKADAISNRLLWTGLMETAIMGLLFVILLTGAWSMAHEDLRAWFRGPAALAHGPALPVAQWPAIARERGLALAKQYGFQWQPLPEGIAAEILVNVTPLGMAGGAESNTLAFSEAMVAQASVVFDVVALPAETPLIRLAQQRGKQTISGAEVIALQAVEQFALYTGVRPDSALVAEASAFATS